MSKTKESVATCALAWSVRVQEAVGGAPSGVAALLSLQKLQRVAVALSCGRLFLVTSTRPEAEGSFVLSELGAATELRCLAAVPTPHGFEVWAGGDGLWAYLLGAAGVCGAERVRADSAVALLAAADEPYVVAYCDPGVCVYAWSVLSRRQTARLDCSKLAPCSESLQSISIDERLSAERCKVTSLCCVGNLAYVGTAWGCVIVADAPTLRPLTVFRPYEQDVVAMVPLLPHDSSHTPMLATLGSGYRPLLQRFAPNNQQSTNNASAHSGFYCLLWRAHHWLPD
ncbi:uncharacterized protein LOC113228995 [Hyposmocoma kahamanoa]|uniref:uncharacterized protein LOC113228995 n=1 Tax=Hyposmocoma kahamanoa TaxID=1477025 RepID=UPI000E6D6F71|nr:uncharacterized protein LOC113228995 [Hyposmocoma kahamanoa]